MNKLGGKYRWWLLALGILLFGGMLMAMLSYFIVPLALPINPVMVRSLPSSEVLARDGRFLGFVADAQHYRQQPLPAGEPIPPLVKQVLLAAEDKRFDSHGGIDAQALARALWDALCTGQVRSGASTITMQLAKMSAPPAERSLCIKVKEALLARHWELIFDKEKILRCYLDHADFGQLCRGIETAARLYFNVHARDLQLEQVALLIAQLRSPTYFNPFAHPNRAKAARDRILQAMGQADLAATPLGLNPPPAWRAQHQLKKAGRLCINPVLQVELDQILKHEIAALKEKNVGQGAAILVDNHSGEVLATVASAQWDDPRGGQLDGTAQRRSAGSTLKPFVYLLALEAGKNPASIYADLPDQLLAVDGIEAPSNYNHKYLGPISMRLALASSQNIPAMLALNEHGGEKSFLAKLRELGYAVPEGDYGLGLAIGNAHVSLQEQAAAFACLARGGSYLPLRYYKDEPQGEPQQLIQAAHAWQLTEMLSDPQARESGFGYASALRFSFPCAVKTGTSSNFRDNWCIGYTRDYTLAVWVGNFDNTAMDGVSGLTGAGPIFHRMMAYLHDDVPPTPWERPEGLLSFLVDERTGKAGGTHAEWMTQAQADCASLAGDYDEQGRVLLPIEFEDWLSAQGAQAHQEYAIDVEKSLDRKARILTPPTGTTLHIDPYLPEEGRLLPLQSTINKRYAVWDSPTLKLFKRGSQWYACLEVGEHQISVEDARSGEKASSRIEVMD